MILSAVRAAFLAPAATAMRPSTQLLAQDKPILNITRPTQWAFKGDTALVQAGAPFKIQGTALHSRGVQQVLVNGRPSSVVRDKANPRFWLFENTLPADSVTDVVTFTLVSMNGDSLKYLYTTNSSLVGPDSPKKNAATKVIAEIPRQVTPQGEPKLPAPQVILPKPWRNNQKRNIGYVAAAVAGVIAGANGASVGFGIAGIAAIAAGVDAGITSSHVAKAKAGTPPNPK